MLTPLIKILCHNNQDINHYIIISYFIVSSVRNIYIRIYTLSFHEKKKKNHIPLDPRVFCPLSYACFYFLKKVLGGSLK